MKHTFTVTKRQAEYTAHQINGVDGIARSSVFEYIMDLADELKEDQVIEITLTINKSIKKYKSILSHMSDD